MTKNSEIKSASFETGFELRSEEVQEILQRVPHWMIRWGTVLIFCIILMLFFLSWLIKYPDIITTKIVITTTVPPEKVMARTSGQIETLLIQDKGIVQKDTPLAIIKNTAYYNDVFLLKRLVSEYSEDKSFDFEKLNDAQLGDIESAYALFQSAYIANQLNEKLQPFQVEAIAQSSENRQIIERLDLLEQQKSISENELQLKKNELKRYETLFGKGVISEQDFENKKLIYIQTERSDKSLMSSISQLKSSLINNKQNGQNSRINGTKEEVNLKSNKMQAFYQLKKVIKEWELMYVLKSSVDGYVTFLQVWTENQSITSGENVFTIIPIYSKDYVGKLKAPAFNSGKIKVGQKINVRLANYPDREFGIIEAAVKNISLVPDREGNILIDVILPKGLETSYHKKIPFQQEMEGNAEIITEDLRLTERLLYQFRDIFSRTSFNEKKMPSQ